MEEAISRFKFLNDVEHFTSFNDSFICSQKSLKFFLDFLGNLLSYKNKALQTQMYP